MGIPVAGYYQPPGEPVPADSVYGYKLTPFPRKLWDEWIKHNGEGELIQGKHIIVADTVEDIKGEIARKVGVRMRTFGSVPYRG